jgi:hypothetical protein
MGGSRSRCFPKAQSLGHRDSLLWRRKAVVKTQIVVLRLYITHFESHGNVATQSFAFHCFIVFES